MTGRKWKPGDVALVTWGRGDEVMIRTNRPAVGDVWHGPNGWLGDASAKHVRSLVVIDPEDREQVGRLLDALAEKDWEVGEGDQLADDVQAALREFANPTPPKPEEPTGLGAVVEDTDGRLWFRMTLENQTWPGEVWQEQYGCDPDRWRKYADVNAVRVLSEGWSE